MASKYWQLVVFLLVILTCCHSLQAAKKESIEADSLKSRVPLLKDDTAKANLLVRLFWLYRRNNLDSAFEYANQGLRVSKKINYTKGIGNSLYAIGIVSKVRGETGKAMDLFGEASLYYESAGNTSGVISCVTESAAINLKQGHYEKALEYLHKALEIYNDSLPKERLSRIYHLMGGIYYSLDQSKKALEYHNKSLKINQSEQYELGISVNYNNIGNVYRSMGKSSRAIDSYLESMAIKERLDDKNGLASVINNLGLTYVELGNYSKAIEYHHRTLAIFLEMDDKHGISLSYANLGFDNLLAGNNLKAVEFSIKGKNIAEKHGFLEIAEESSRTLAKANARIGNFKEAFQFQEEYSRFKDSLMNKEVMKKISNLEYRFEMDNKEKEIAILNAEKEKQDIRIQKGKTIGNLMAITAFLSITVLVLLFISFRSKQRVNRKLKEMNEIKSRFFANIAHEFRTPLTLLSGPLENLINHPEKRDPELIRMMYRNANRLVLLNNQLMDLSKLEAGTLTLQLLKADLTAALKGMVTSFESLAKQKDIEYRHTFPEEQLNILFDRDKIEKIVYNLLSNAFKFTDNNGRVEFTAGIINPNIAPVKIRKTASRFLKIEVGDNGKGISGGELPRIFDRFYQAETGFRRKYEGTGLGLAITRELVEMHKGHISASSIEGRGTVFTVVIPVDDTIYPAGDIIRSENDFSENSSQSSMKASQPENNTQLDINNCTEEQERDDNLPVLLLVEDNDDMRKFIKDSLGEKFYFIEAPDGLAGLDLATDKIPDLIITDLMMPHMDGVELCEKLKTDERTSHIPVIMLTALANVESRIKGLETGADDYITKPFNREELQVRCNNLIEQRKKLREKYRKDGKIDPEGILVTSADKRFMEKVNQIVDKHLSNPELDVELMVSEVGMSRSQLHRKLKALTDQTTTEFIRNIRLRKAAIMLKNKYGSIAEVCYAVGFNSLSYFTRCFHELYGVAPSGYREG
ncbi:MAG: tetratricopeptide repeat protein [Bacteroidales bacterium]|nr:tetratricopeptide repeat protein [Bacteroidales bacterium]